MRYLLHLRGDKEEPGYSLVADDYGAAPGEVVVDSSPEGKVWDASAALLRERTPSEDLASARASKEVELRAAADGWYQGSVRAFEGAVVSAKWAKGQALNPEEQAVFNEMQSNYTKLKNLISRVRAATTVSEVEAVSWT